MCSGAIAAAPRWATIRGRDGARRCHGRSRRVTMRGVRPVPVLVPRGMPSRRSGRRPAGFSASASKASSTSRATAPVVITPNHVSFMDPILVTIPIRRALHYMALEPFFRIRGLGAIMRWARAFPIQEGEPDNPAVRRALRVLQAGGAARDLSRGRPLARRPASSLPPGRVPARAGHRGSGGARHDRRRVRGVAGSPAPSSSGPRSSSRTTRRSTSPRSRPTSIARPGPSS